jgi:hypothetical protein
MSICYKATKQKTPWVFSPQENYTGSSTAAGRRIFVPTFADKGVSRGQRSGSSLLFI